MTLHELFARLSQIHVESLSCKERREYFPGGSKLWGWDITITTNKGVHKEQFLLSASEAEYEDFITKATTFQ